MITISNLTKSFGKLKALDDVSLNCERGQSIALVGPNGSGKTTLIKSILGMVVPDSGKILFDTKDIRNDFKYRAHIGYMPQIGRYPENTTIGQVIDMMKDIRKSESTTIDEELITNFGLEKLYDKRMRTLSGGTRQKVSAALAFLFNAPVLILDEPTAGLDPISSEILKVKIQKECKNGKLILITSHILSELDDLINYLIYMQDGKVKVHKSIQEITGGDSTVKISKAITSLMINQD